ncbi:MAG TPA: phage holin family protein, partial [Jatrophihabitantaceae bacterium]|nr:phage holin family protein [Jatrophihabitantaceae bacterium]
PTATEPATGDTPAWQPVHPRRRLFPLIVSWLATGIALMVAAALLPGMHIENFGGALLIADAAILLVAADVTDGVLRVDNFGWALLASLVVAAVSVVLAVILGADDTSAIRIAGRIARRQGIIATTDVPGIVFLEIDGLALPVLRRAMRDGNAPNMARWLASGEYSLTEWETDLSSQTGASQAGLLLGSNEDISAFRWVEKETGTLMTCSAPPDCAEIERRRATGIGLLANGGSSRGNLLSGEADDVILTVSRMDAEKKSNPGYRAFLANGDNVTRTLVLFGWEVILEWTAALRAIRRDVQPRGHRGGIYPLMRAALCVFVRDLIVSGVLTDMMRGRPAVYATFSSYDEVAHHSGLERADTLEALRKLDEHFGQIERARRSAPRPYEIVVLSDHGQTQGATFKQRNGYGLDELVNRSLSTGAAAGIGGGDEQNSMVGLAVNEATGKKAKRPKNDVSDRDVVVLGSGNLGLVYLMEEDRRLTLEEIESRHPQLLTALRSHPHVGWLLVRSSQHGAVALGAGGTHYLSEGRVEGDDPLALFSANAPQHLLRTDGFEHVADIMVGSFYDPDLDEGCAFEELISFHGGIGGVQTRPFILHPSHLEVSAPIIGAAGVHGVLSGWRHALQREPAAVEPKSADRTPLARSAGHSSSHSSPASTS